MGAQAAPADVFTSPITTGNTALSGFTGPFANVTINLINPTTANVTFDSLTNGGFIYLMGDGSSADLNVNAGNFSVSGVTGSNSLVGFTPGPYTVTNPPGTSQVDGFGPFNMTIDSFDGFTHSSTQISFTLTDLSGTWASASNVLAANPDGFDAAMHVFACATSATNPCNASTGATATGFAAETGGVRVSQPTSLGLLGAGVIAVWLIPTRHRRRRFTS